MISIEQATQTRIALLKAGFCPIPFACRGKRPVIRNWQRLAGSIDEACVIGLWASGCTSMKSAAPFLFVS